MAPKFKGSLKLAAALDSFSIIHINGAECSDLGCNVGGFTSELLNRGARQVHAIDTGYGTLDWNLRNDPRVDVRERQNALHADFLKNQDIIVIDVAWTKQNHILPAAFSYLSDSGQIFSLLKPQYERKQEKRSSKKIILSESESDEIAEKVFHDYIPPTGYEKHLIESPIKGGQDQKGNKEFWLVFQPLK